MKLYELSDNLAAVMELIENGAEGLEETLEALDLSFEEKIDACARIHRNLLGERDMCKAEAHRLSERAATKDKQAAKLKEYMETAMRRIGREEVASALFKIKLAMNPPSVNVIDEKLIPQDYWTSTQPQLSKTYIMTALKAGLPVPGAEIKQEKSLRIS